MDLANSHTVTLHASQFPDQLEKDLRHALVRREVPPKFHYESRRQARRWLAVHEACSPARRDPSVARMYDEAFRAVSGEVSSGRCQVMGLGCGGGQKESSLIQAMAARRMVLSLVVADAGLALVAGALNRVRSDLVHQGLLQWLSRTQGLVCDLDHDEDPWPLVASLANADCARLYTFFGVLPNVEPARILSRLAGAMLDGDTMVFSANLVPEKDYAAEVERVLPQYDNTLTNRWLMTVLEDLGAPVSEESVSWMVARCPSHAELRRLEAHYTLPEDAVVRVDDTDVEFSAGERLRLFYSYRYTPSLLAEVLERSGLRLTGSWISPQGEEGVFLARRASDRRLSSNK